MSAATFGMWVEVNKTKVLERFSSDELVQEVASRNGVSVAREDERDQISILSGCISEALEYLRSGRTDDALLTMERISHPKFKSVAHSTAAYLARVSSK